VLLVAGMTAQAASYLSQAGWLPVLNPMMWDSSGLLAEKSLIGQLLHTLVGYVDRPTGIQLVAYLVTIAVIVGLTRIVNKQSGGSSAGAGAAVLVLATVVALWPYSTAEASHKVYYPTVEKGETEIELRGHVTFDNDRALSNQQVYKLGVGHGFTDFWFAEIYAELEREGSSEYEVESYEIENLFRLVEPGKYWADLGFLVEYSHAGESGNPNKWELTPIIQKQIGSHLVTLNFTFERETGSNSSDEWEFAYAWQYRLIGRQALEFGLEGYGEVGELTKWDNSGDQHHSVGPAIFGKLKTTGRNALKYRMALLFGLNDSTPDTTLTGMLEYEF